MKYLPLAIALLSAPAAAHPPVVGTEITSDGLGADGVASQWNWVGGSLHVFILTGDDPEPYGSARITIDPSINPPLHPRPLCVVTGAETGLEYVPSGYVGSYWPMVTFQTGEYTLNDGTLPTTLNVTWLATDFLRPRTAYSLVVACAQKPAQ